MLAVIKNSTINLSQSSFSQVFGYKTMFSTALKLYNSCHMSSLSYLRWRETNRSWFFYSDLSLVRVRQKNRNYFKKNLKYFFFLIFFLTVSGFTFSFVDLAGNLSNNTEISFTSWLDWLFGGGGPDNPDTPKTDVNPAAEATKNNSTTPPAEEEEEVYDYDLFFEMWGPELTWWEWIQDSLYRLLFGAPVEPFVPFEEYIENYFNKYKVPNELRERYLNEIFPPDIPPPSDEEQDPSVRVIVINPVEFLYDTRDFFIELTKNLLRDAWNVFKFSIYYVDQNLRYLVDLVPISAATWQYLILLGFSTAALGYMFALFVHEEVLYTRVIYHDLRHIPIREIYFFHEYFLGWSTIICCLLLFTTIK